MTEIVVVYNIPIGTDFTFQVPSIVVALIITLATQIITQVTLIIALVTLIITMVMIPRIVS